MAFALYGYDKYNAFTEFYIGEPNLPFDIADNINELPNSAKCEVENEDGNPYAPNTPIHETESDMWFVVKQDDCEFIAYKDDDTPMYRHTLQLGDMLEYLSYRRVPSCVFPANRYTLEETFTRLFNIAKVSITITWANYDFVDKDTKNKYFSFNKNYQLSTAIRDICKSFNAIAYLWYDSGFQLGFRQRYGYGVPLGDIDTIFPSVQRKSSSNADKYMTRTYSALENVKNSKLVLFPTTFGIHGIDNTSTKFDGDNAIIPLPTKIADVAFVQILRPCCVVEQIRDSYGYVLDEYKSTTTTYNNLTRSEWRTFIISQLSSPEFVYGVIDSDDVNASSNIPNEYTIGVFANNDGWENDFTVLSPKDFETTDPTNVANHDQEHAFTWEDKATNIKIAKAITYPSSYTKMRDYELFSVPATGSDTAHLIIRMYATVHYKTFYRTAYKPIGDVVLSYDSDDEAQDERPYNQSGTILDGYSVSKLVNAYANESATETLTRYKEFTSFDNIYKCGQKVVKDNRHYVIGQRSIDCYINKYLVLFTLTRDKVARDENVSADTDVATYAVPDKNLVSRVQIYKDYLEIGIDNSDRHHDTPYLNSSYDLLALDDATNIGFKHNFEYVFASYDDDDVLIDYLTAPISRMYYVNSMIYRVDFIENYIIGINQSGADVQTPTRYADANAELKRINGFFVDSVGYKTTMTLTDYEDLPQISETTFGDLISWYSIHIDEPNYDKSSYEIPVFQYHIEVNSGTNEKAIIEVGEDILEPFAMEWGSPLSFAHFYYVISDIPISVENADERWNTLFIDESKDEYDNIVSVSTGTTSDYIFTLLSAYPSTQNSVALSGKHIGIYACSGATAMTTPKFLFAMNYYNHTSNTTIPININNWKI